MYTLLTRGVYCDGGYNNADCQKELYLHVQYTTLVIPASPFLTGLGRAYNHAMSTCTVIKDGEVVSKASQPQRVDSGRNPESYTDYIATTDSDIDVARLQSER